MKFVSKPLLLAFLSAIALFTHAQDKDTLEIKRNEKGKVSFARFNPNMNAKIQHHIAKGHL
jgi:hypothetical protein